MVSGILTLTKTMNGGSNDTSLTNVKTNLYGITGTVTLDLSSEVTLVRCKIDNNGILIRYAVDPALAGSVAPNALFTDLKKTLETYTIEGYLSDDGTLTSIDKHKRIAAMIHDGANPVGSGTAVSFVWRGITISNVVILDYQTEDIWETEDAVDTDKIDSDKSTGIVYGKIKFTMVLVRAHAAGVTTGW